MGGDYKMRRRLASHERVWKCEDDSSVHTTYVCVPGIWVPAIPDPRICSAIYPLFVFLIAVIVLEPNLVHLAWLGFRPLLIGVANDEAAYSVIPKQAICSFLFLQSRDSRDAITGGLHSLTCIIIGSHIIFLTL